MKIKIQIKHYITGSVLFEFEREGNTLRDTIVEANLRGADLREADLYGADLYGADLRGADLEKLPQDYINQASRDMLFIFQCLKGELPFLRDKLIKGEIDGTAYEGDCACLIGTLANADGGLDEVCRTIPYYEKGVHNPAEAWFLNIHKGDTPKDNQFAAHALKLVDMVLGDTPKRKKSKDKGGGNLDN